MRPSAILLAIAGLSSGSFHAAHKPRPTSDKGIEGRLIVAKPSVKVGEKLKMLMLLKNATSDNLWVAPIGPTQFKCKGTFLNSGGHLESEYDGGAYAIPGPRDLVRLEPGFYYGCENDVMWINSPGEYNLSVVQWRDRPKGKPPGRVWSGGVESNKVRITVR
ncbi:MAG: hypothetical protein ACHQ50_15830 [Fimbriimonadales bacterium]